MMATPDSNRTAQRPHAPGPSFPHSPFRIPSTPRHSTSTATSKSHRRQASSISHSPLAPTISRSTLLGSPFSVTRVSYTSQPHPSDQILRVYAQHSATIKGPTDTDIDIDLEESLSDTPSRSGASARRDRRSASGSSCSGSGTSSASLLSLGRSSEESRRCSVAIWDEGDTFGLGLVEGISRFDKGAEELGLSDFERRVAGEQGCKTQQAEQEQFVSMRGTNGYRAHTHTLDMPSNASLITLSPTANSPASVKTFGQARTFSRTDSARTVTYTPPTTRMTDIAAPNGPNDSPNATKPPAPGSGSNATPARRKSPFHFIPRLIPAYRRRTRAPSVGHSTVEGRRRENDDAVPRYEIPISTRPAAEAPQDQNGMGLGLSPALMARTPSSPSHLSSDDRTFCSARPFAVGSLGAFPNVEDEDMDVPSPSKPPTGHRPGNPRRSTATGSIRGNKGQMAMLAPSAFTLSPGPGVDTEAGAGVKARVRLAGSTTSATPNGSSERSTASTSTSTSTSSSASSRPSFRRGITAPGAFPLKSSLLDNDPSSGAKGKGGVAFMTPPPLFNDIRPSPAAFASTGLIKKKSKMRGSVGPSPVIGPDSGLGSAAGSAAGWRGGVRRGGAGEGVEGMYSPEKVKRPVFDLSRLGRGALALGLDRVEASANVKVTHGSTPPSGPASVSTFTSTSDPSARSTANTTNTSNTSNTSHVPPGRGLRRKGSTMFSTSGSSGSINLTGITGPGVSVGVGVGAVGAVGVNGVNGQVGRNRSTSVLGGVQEGSPVTPTKHGFTRYNTITPPPHRAPSISYPFARPRFESASSTKGNNAVNSSPTVAISPVAHTRPHCLGASTSTTASTSTEESSSSPLRARLAVRSGQKRAEANMAAGNGGGPVVRASNPMLAATFRQHGQIQMTTPPSGTATGSGVGLNTPKEQISGGSDLERIGGMTGWSSPVDRLSGRYRPIIQTEISGNELENDINDFEDQDEATDIDEPNDTHTAPSHGRSSGGGAYERSERRNKLDADFVLVQGIGAGEFSQVWKVRSRRDGAVSAVKAGKPYMGVKNRLRQLEEVAILNLLTRGRPSQTIVTRTDTDNPTSSHSSAIGHPHVLPLLSAWEHKSRLYIHTPLLPLGDLSRFLEACGDTAGLGEVRTWKLLVELVDALRYVHALGVVHLDIKPGNVLVSAGGSVVLGDFGMAARLKSQQGGRQGKGTGVEVGLMQPPRKKRDGGFYWPSDDNKNGAGDGDGGYGVALTIRPTAQKGNGGRHVPYASPSPMLERDVEGDREYLSPEALADDAVGQMGTHSDVFSLGVVLLEAAGNVALPSNGDGWLRLRNDDFSDFDGCYLPRCRTTHDPSTGEVVTTLDKRPGTDTNLPVLSDELSTLIKSLMRSDPAKRATLDEVWEMQLIRRVRGLMGRAVSVLAGDIGVGQAQRTEEGEVKGQEERKWAGALVEEEEDAVGLLFP